MVYKKSEGKQVNEIFLNDLPKYSDWAKYILGIKQLEKKIEKTANEVIREFEFERWGKLFSLLKDNPDLTLREIDGLICGEEEVPFYENGEFQLLPALSGHTITYNWITSILKQHCNDVSGLVELGAGYGAIILKLAKLHPFNKLPLFAAEYTDSGCELIKMLAEKEAVKIKVGYCDFREKLLQGFDIPEGSVIYTCYATHYVPVFPDDFPDYFIKSNPKMVIHFEPIYEHCREDTLLDLMCRRYIELNDYNTNLVTVLHKQQKQGKIKILEERKNVMGYNFLPVSLIRWKPEV